MHIGELIRRHARWTPDKTAVVCGSVRETYREFDRRVNALLNGLVALGLWHGDRVAALSDNSYRYLEVFGAIAKGGLVLVPLNPRLTAGEIRFMLQDSGAALLFVGNAYRAIAEEIRADCSDLKQVIYLDEADGEGAYEALLAHSPGEDPLVEVQPDDLIAISYTGGTTATPKGAMMTHRNLLANAANVALEFEIDARSVGLIVLPQSTSGCIHHVVVPHLYVGASLVVMDARRFEPARFCETIEREGVTDVQLVPTMIYRLLDDPSLGSYDLRSLRTIGYGSAPMAAERLREALQRLGPIFVQVYGLTEASSVVTVLPRQDHVEAIERGNVGRLASCGRPTYSVEVRLIDDHGNEVPVGEVGEIAVRGDTVTKGYWQAPEATAAALHDGWLSSGDMARADERGYYYITDRKRDLIISGGLNISAREIEEVIYRHPAVLECAVIAVPDEHWGEAVKAVVVPRRGQTVTEAELIDLCRQHLASYKKPRSVDFVPELPKSQMGKILKRELKRQYWGGADRLVH